MTLELQELREIKAMLRALLEADWKAQEAWNKARLDTWYATGAHGLLCWNYYKHGLTPSEFLALADAEVLERFPVPQVGPHRLAKFRQEVSEGLQGRPRWRRVA